MLLMSIVFVADLLKIRGDPQSAEREVRKTISESLAIQLTLMASHGDIGGLKQSLLQFIDRHDGMRAAALVDSEGAYIAEHGDQQELAKVTQHSDASYVSVPIFNKEERWGEVRVVFEPSSARFLEFRYYTFVLVGSFIICFLFLRRVLVQLDPGRVVPSRVNSAFNMFSDSVIILDYQLQILIVNKAAEKVVGKSSEQLLGKRLDDWPWVKDEQWQSPWAAAMKAGINLSDLPVHLKTENGSRILMASCSVVGDEEENNRGVLVTLNDMTAIEAKNRELAHTLKQLRKSEHAILEKNIELENLATRDSLTGLYNRRAFLERFEQNYAEAKANGTPLCCIMSDIDHFKRVNDTFGHGVGDEIICAVANTLAANTDDFDTVGRYGGEEFVLILPNKTVDDAKKIAESIRQKVADLVGSFSVNVGNFSSSFGVALLTSDVSDVMDLIDRADQALYFAKQSGRNRVIVYSENVVRISESAEQSGEITAEGSAVLSRVVELEAIAVERARDLDVLKTHDELTGIPNRTLFFQRIDTEIIRAERAGTRVGLVSLELSEFDKIVSTFGHVATDELVVAFVARLSKALRSTDQATLVVDDQCMSRITSNEYGVLLSDLSSADRAMPVLARLRRVLADAFVVDDQKIFIGVTMGISLYPQSGSTAVELLESASLARVEARNQSGKFTYLFASDSLDRQSREYIELETELHDAVASNAFNIVYQPKLSLADRQIHGLEALLRWQHPEKGFISPDRFIQIAESCGLIFDISSFVFNRALSQLRQWYDQGWTNLKLSINISALQLRQDDLALEVLAALKKAQLPASCIELEITETSMIESPDSAFKVLSELRQAGVSISMDDFGTGYTSLALLAELPLDCVKIDRSFILDITKEERNKAIVESIITMSHALHLSVVGEGIEQQDQHDLLQNLGCDEIQGYLISRPLDPEEVPAILSHYNTPSIKRKVA